MPGPIAIQPSKFEKTTLFIETLWISLLFYGFYIIARFLPDSPEFKVILHAIYENGQQNQRGFENQAGKAANILFELVNINFVSHSEFRSCILDEIGLQDTDEVQLESFQACIIKKLAGTPTLEAIECFLSRIDERLSNGGIKDSHYASQLHPLKIYRVREQNESHLDLKGKLINDLTVIKLCMALNKNPSITSVDASCNHLGNISAIAFSKTRGLKFLNLHFSNIGNVGAIYLANNTVFESLDISSNSIGNTGIIALAKNKHLRSIDIHSNDVDGDFSARVFSSNTSLKSLCLGSHCYGGTYTFNISDDGANALAGNTTIKALEFKGNSICEAGYIALAANTTLRSIKGCRHLQQDAGYLKAFFNNKTLIHCDAWDNHMSKFTSKDFASRNKAFLKNQLNFQVFSSMLESNQLTFDLLWYIGSFLITESDFLKQIMESAKLRVLRKNTRASEAGMFSVGQLPSISKIARDNETASKYDALLWNVHEITPATSISSDSHL